MGVPVGTNPAEELQDELKRTSGYYGEWMVYVGQAASCTGLRYPSIFSLGFVQLVQCLLLEHSSFRKLLCMSIVSSPICLVIQENACIIHGSVNSRNILTAADCLLIAR